MERKQNLNVCVIGHVDSGKSTTVGNLAYQLGAFDKRQMAKLEADAQSRGKGTFAFAYFTDDTEAERGRGITISASLRELKLQKHNVNIIDCPGHRDFIKNMGTGASQADVALAVVPADDPSTGMSPKGTFRDHIMISSVMGVKRMAIIVTKLGPFPPEKQKETFEWVKKEALFVAKNLHQDKDPVVLPIDGLEGIGVVEKGKKFDWFEGWQAKDASGAPVGEKVFTLEGLLSYYDVPPRPVDKELRLPISDTVTITGIGQVLTGRLESGTLRPGAFITIQPAGVTGEVKSLQIHKQDRKEVFCGENVGLALKSGAKGDLTQIKKGNVISDTKNNPCVVYPACEARVVVVEHPKGIKVGYCPVISIGPVNVPAKVAKFINKKGPKDKEPVTDFDTIQNKDNAVCIIVPQKAIVMEVMKDFPCLGRFVLRDGGKVVAVGSILRTLTEAQCKELGVDLDVVAAGKAVPAAATKATGKASGSRTKG